MADDVLADDVRADDVRADDVRADDVPAIGAADGRVDPAGGAAYPAVPWSGRDRYERVR
jgi:hypothetical protein